MVIELRCVEILNFRDNYWWYNLGPLIDFYLDVNMIYT